MQLNELSPAEGSRKSRKRVGRGVGSGWGKTAGRGNKGYNSRSGGGVSPGFEGGQMPIQRRLPKRGFTNIFRKTYEIVNIGDLAKFETGNVVDVASLVHAGLIKGKRDAGVKLLGKGEITYPLTIRLDKISQRAKEKIEAAGGTVEIGN
jgi:large subunit ribosomal protein L15